jgi:formylmethanofuran dehydrogenase subunit E
LVKTLPTDLLDGAIRFHGHLGPFLVLGLKAGLAGVAYLGKDYFKINAKVETASHPPRSCFIDGVQFASGCTTGKGNIEVKTSDKVSVEFALGERKIKIEVRNDVLEALDHVSSNSQAELISKEFMQKTDAELFLISKN